jgi:hypothetical protein
MPEAPRQPDDKPLMRSLGEFFGHIVQGIKTDVDPAAKKVVTRQTIEEEARQTPDGPVILRRTIIEEVEVPKTPPAEQEPRP